MLCPSVLCLWVLGAAVPAAAGDGPLPIAPAELTPPVMRPVPALAAPACPLPAPGLLPGGAAPAARPIRHTPPAGTLMPETPAGLDPAVGAVSRNTGGVRVVVGRARLLTLEKALPESAYEASPPGGQAAVAVGDPDLLKFAVVDARRVRLTGLRLGVTDLSVVTKDGTLVDLEVAVVADLDLLRARVAAMFPDADVRFGQIRDHIVVEGQVRDTRQVARVLQTVNAYLLSLDAGRSAGAPDGSTDPAELVIRGGGGAGEPPALPEFARLGTQAEVTPPRVINLLRVPGPQQVLLKVQVAELNRTALRELGVSFLARTGGGGFGSNISEDLPFGGGSSAGTTGAGGSAGSTGGSTGGTGGGMSMGMDVDPLSVTNLLTAGTPVFGVFGGADFSVFLSALRRNDLFRVLAEPNLVALQGQEASFLAGGEFPIPVPQASGGAGSVITVAYREFGVGLSFVPFVIDGDMVRLSVAPEVSSLDFAQGITLQGFRVPALNKRRTSTVVELRHGQTLAISGLLQLEITGTTGRIPGLGDLPYIGPSSATTRCGGRRRNW